MAELEADGGAELMACEGYIPNQSNVLRMLGYFSLIGQLRVSLYDVSNEVSVTTCYFCYLNFTRSCKGLFMCGCSLLRLGIVLVSLPASKSLQRFAFNCGEDTPADKPACLNAATHMPANDYFTDSVSIPLYHAYVLAPLC